MENKVKPAVIGGVVLGLLSAIPFVNIVNVCCCLWAILGGMLASHLYVKNSPTPATAGDGAIVGALAGAVGAVISLVVGIPLSLVSGAAMRGILVSMMERVDPQQADIVRRQMEATGESIAGAIVHGLILAVLIFLFAIIGGLIGIPLFEKRKGGPVPPPPYPGGGPGSYAA
jgi:CDP-diglyceride synthetase